MNYVHNLLEVISCIFSHNLETVRLILPVIIVDLFIHSGSDAASLEGWQYEDLRNLSPKLIKRQMCLKHCEESHKVFRFSIID